MLGRGHASLTCVVHDDHHDTFGIVQYQMWVIRFDVCSGFWLGIEILICRFNRNVQVLLCRFQDVVLLIFYVIEVCCV